MIISSGDVWFVHFPLEADPSQFLPRPVIVLDEENLQVLAVKVTKTEPRDNDIYDTPIVYWQHANLRFKSTARVSKTLYIPKSLFKFKIGELHPDDFSTILMVFEKFLAEQE